MPRISAFYGIVVAMYNNDHNPPHFHAIYGEFEVKVAIGAWVVLEGALPRGRMRILKRWTVLHRRELEENWKSIQDGRPAATIEPLP